VETDPQLAPPVVSVVVVHDPGAWFDEVLAALAAQDYPNLRHLFIVAHRSDEARTGEIGDQIRAVIPQAFVRPIGVNPGFGPAVDEVLRLVEGDNGFFLLCHDDVAPESHAVRTLVTELYRSNAGMVGPKLVDWDEPRRLQHVGLGLDRYGETDPIVEPGEIDQEQHDAVRDVFVLPSACVLVRADLFRQLGGYDPAITFHGDDAELCWRAHLQGARVVVAPDAVVRHRERLEERRPDLNHQQLRARHRMRAVATLTGGRRLFARSLQIVLLTIVELVVGLFTGRFGEAFASLRALGGLIPRTPGLVRRRRAVRAQRLVPEREILGLQVRGSARLSSYLRGRETTLYVGADTTVRRWREASFGPVLAWFAVLVGIVVGSRTFIDRGVPQVGEFLHFPTTASDLVELYRSAFDGRGLGVTAHVPTGWLTLAGLSALAGFQMALAMTLAVIGMFVLGAAGAWRLATVFPSNRARIATMVVYAATPLVPGLLATGNFSALAWYAAFPWSVHLLRRSLGIDTADPSLAALDIVDGIAPMAPRQRARFLALLSLVVAVSAAFVPVTIVLWLVAGISLSLATLLVGGSFRTAGWLAFGTVVSAVVATVLNLPWSTSWTWSSLVGAPLAGPRGTGLVDLASLSIDDRAFAVLALALYLPLVAACAIARAWRLTWAVRGAVLVIVFLGAAVLADLDDLPFTVPDAGLLLVPVALGLGLASGAIAGGLSEDVRGRGFGWRQPLAVLATAAIVVAAVPGVASIGSGSWDAPRTSLPGLLAAQLPAAEPDGSYRVLFIGGPRVLPVPGREYADGIAAAVVDDGSLDFTDRWAGSDTDADDAITDALDRIATGSTLRGGRLLAPLGIRFVVVPRVDGARSTVADPVPVPEGLIAALQDQLDIGETYGAPNLDVYENQSWIPATAQLSGATAEATFTTGDEALVRSDLSSAAPAFVDAGHLDPSVDEVEPGVVHVAVPFDDQWSLRVGGTELTARASFGLATAFDVAAAGQAELAYEEPSSRTVLIVVQTLLWLVVLVAASRARSPFVRRRSDVVDETLIDLDDDRELDDGAAPDDDHEPFGADPLVRGRSADDAAGGSS
jgi:GT2 family glycosyltransferase